MATTSVIVRHPGYAESFHSNFLADLLVQRNLALATSPYSASVHRNVDADFFGVGYLISSYTTLYDLFGKFMSGLDLEELWRDSAISALSQVNIQEYINDKKVKLDEEIDINTLPEFKRNMREINAVFSSSFVVGCAKIESKRVKDYAVISIEAIASLIPIINERFNGELAWCKSLITNYAQLIKLYFSVRIDTDIKTYTLRSEDILWPFTVLDYDRRALNSLGPQFLENETTKETWLEKNKALVGGVSILMWTVQGAYIGSAYPPYGTIIGAVIGFVIGVALYFMQ